MNFLAAHGVGGVIEQSVNPKNWIHNSMHPNGEGHDAMREAVKMWMARNDWSTVTPRACGPSARRAGGRPDTRRAVVSRRRQ